MIRGRCTDILDAILATSHHLGQPADHLLPNDLPDAVQVPVDNAAEFGLFEVFLEALGRPELRGEDIDQAELVETRLAEQEGEGFDGLGAGGCEVELNEFGEEGEDDLCKQSICETIQSGRDRPATCQDFMTAYHP